MASSRKKNWSNKYVCWKPSLKKKFSGSWLPCLGDSQWSENYPSSVGCCRLFESCRCFCFSTHTTNTLTTRCRLRVPASELTMWIWYVFAALFHSHCARFVGRCHRKRCCRHEHASRWFHCVYGRKANYRSTIDRKHCIDCRTHVWIDVGAGTQS